MQQQPILDVPGQQAQCSCLHPIREERAERKGASRAYCGRCGLPIPLKLGRAGKWQ